MDYGGVPGFILHLLIVELLKPLTDRPYLTRAHASVGSSRTPKWLVSWAAETDGHAVMQPGRELLSTVSISAI